MPTSTSENGLAKATLLFGSGAFLVFAALSLFFDLTAPRTQLPHYSAVLLGGLLAALVVSLAAATSFAFIARKLKHARSSTVFLLGSASALVTCVASVLARLLHLPAPPIAVQVAVAILLVCAPSIIVPTAVLGRTRAER